MVKTVIALALGILFIPAALADDSKGANLEVRLRGLNAAVEQQPAAQSLAARAETLRELMRVNPERALSTAFGESTAQKLRSVSSATAELVESWEDFEGQVETLVVDDFEKGQSEHRTMLRTPSGALEAHLIGFDGELAAGTKIRASGIRLGQVIAARVTTTAPQLAACTTTGDQKVLVLLLNFQGATLPSYITQAAMRDVFFGATNSLDSHWRQSSYGKTSASGDVFGPFTLPASNYGANQLYDLQSDAINAADATVDFTRYTRVFLIYPNEFPQAGAVGTVGCGYLLSNDGDVRASTSWIRADFIRERNVCVTVHEGGHNLGLEHASNVIYSGVPLGAIGDVGVHTEYGDPFSSMAHCQYYGTGWVYGHYAAQHKSQLTWLPAANQRTVEQAGTYVIAPLENNLAATQLLRVRRGTGNDRWLWIEFRQPIGDDATLALVNPQVYSGALIHYEDPSAFAHAKKSRLVDFNADSTPGYFVDAPLAAGRTWSDPYSTLRLTVNSASSSGLSVTVSYDNSCAVLSAPSATAGQSGATGSVAVSAPGTCSWIASSNASWISVTGGAAGTGNGTVSYSVAANASGNARVGTISIGGQNFTITQASANSTPSATAVSPSSGTSQPNTFRTFQMTFSDSDGAASLSTVSGLFSQSTQTQNSCYFDWVRSSNLIRLYGEDGVSFAGRTPGTNINLVNNQCTLAVGSSSVASNGNTVTLTVSVSFTPTFLTALNIRGRAQDSTGGDSGWTTLGSLNAAVCGFSLNPSTASLASGAGTGSIGVTSASDCSWTAASNDPWITVTSGASGTGNGSVGYSVLANPGTSSRTGSLTVAGSTFTVTQLGSPAPPCNYTLNPVAANATSAGGANSVAVTTTSNCTWNAASSDPWITVTSGGSGTGNGTVGYSVAANTSTTQRTGRVIIAGIAFTITQQGAPCTFSMNPTSASAAASGGSNTVNVATSGNCTWTAVPNAPWITLVALDSTTGSGGLGYSVAPNPQTTPRTGTISIANMTFTVTQQGAACTYSLSPTSANAGATAGSYAVTVVTGGNCPWTAASNASWITVTAGSSTTGTGVVSYALSANPGTTSRTGTVTIAGSTFTVTQQGAPPPACSYSLNPASATVAATQTSGNVSVTTTSNCSWTATSNTAWISVTAGASGTASGAVGYSVASNPGTTARTGSLTIAGSTFTVTQQAAPCVYSLSSSAAGIAAQGGSGTLTVNTSGNCGWTASSNASWITVTSGASGTGSGPVNFTVSANAATTARTGTLTVAGSTFTITQPGVVPPACSYSINPTSTSLAATAGSGSVSVTTTSNCSWSATSNSNWITVTAGASGAGSGSVSFTVLANTSTSARSGSLTIAGSTFSVTQQGSVQTPCSYTLSSTAATLAATQGSYTVSVTAGSNCAWLASSTVSWLSITSGASGTGNGVIGYSVLPNTTAIPRRGTLTIGGVTFTVTQQGESVVTPTDGLFFVPVTPCRLADTRSTARPTLSAFETRTFNLPAIGCGLPSNAQAYSLNVTVVPNGPLPYLTIWPAGQARPNVSTLNSLDGRIKANAAIVPAGDNGAVSVYVTGTADVILDVNGYFVTGGDANGLAFYPLTPCRVVDTRQSPGDFGGPGMTTLQTRRFAMRSSGCGIPANARAYSLNTTVVPSGQLPYITMFPAGQPLPTVSTLNALTGGVVANAAIVPAGTDGAIDVHATGNTQLILDINGYFAPPGGAGALTFHKVAPCRILDTREAAGTLGGPMFNGFEARDFPIASSGCGVPSTSTAYSLNATVVPQSTLGYLTLWPAGQSAPTVSTLNATDGAISSNAAIVPAGSGGMIKALLTNPTHLILDINGYFAP